MKKVILAMIMFLAIGVNSYAETQPQPKTSKIEFVGLLKFDCKALATGSHIKLYVDADDDSFGLVQIAGYNIVTGYVHTTDPSSYFWPHSSLFIIKVKNTNNLMYYFEPDDTETTPSAKCTRPEHETKVIIPFSDLE